MAHKISSLSTPQASISLITPPQRPLYSRRTLFSFPLLQASLSLAFLWTGRLLGLKAGCFLSFKSQLKGHISRGTQHDHLVPSSHSLSNYRISSMHFSLFSYYFVCIFLSFSCGMNRDIISLVYYCIPRIC